MEVVTPRLGMCAGQVDLAEASEHGNEKEREFKNGNRNECFFIINFKAV